MAFQYYRLTDLQKTGSSTYDGYYFPLLFLTVLFLTLVLFSSSQIPVMVFYILHTLIICSPHFLTFSTYAPIPMKSDITTTGLLLQLPIPFFSCTIHIFCTPHSSLTPEESGNNFLCKVDTCIPFNQMSCSRPKCSLSWLDAFVDEQSTVKSA